ncbi:MAG: hypothetical protein ACUVXF_12145, partial [Desulfobaccales bacterium]
FYVIQPGPILRWWDNGHLEGCRSVPKNFNYRSDLNEWQLSSLELCRMLGLDESEPHSLRAALG